MTDKELFKGKFTRQIHFRPAFDRRDPDPKKNFGIHGMDITFLLIGPLGATQFMFYSGIQLESVANELALKPTRFRGWMGADVGYHSPKPMYDGHKPMDKCSVLEGGTCYYDGSSLAAEDLAKKFVAKGEECVWEELVEVYEHNFEAERA